jgi:uncharacterized protein YjiS (DUF1127 family)
MAMIECNTPHARLKRCASNGSPIVRMIDVWRSRRALAQLDTHRLEDVGLNAKRAAKEEAKPIWDVPKTWRC